MLLIAAATFLLHFSLCIAGDLCPPTAVLAPCTCSYLSVQNWTLQDSPVTTIAPPTTLEPRRKRDIILTPAFSANDTFYTVVDCKISKSLTALEETVSSALCRKQVDKLIVANVPPRKEHTLARLPSGWLKQVRVRHFEVQNSNLAGDFIWHGNPFEGQDKSLLWFAAHMCFLSGSLTYDRLGTVNTKGLDLLPRIQGVDFSHNYLTTITALSFRFPPTNLSTIVLSHNSIQHIEDGTFHHVNFLKYIDLSHNLLETIVSSIFSSPARHLENIDLSWNFLKALPADFFTKMPVLKIVNVSHNFLYSMPDKPWATVWRQLKLIDVIGNFVECNCDLMWLLPILSPTKANATVTLAPLPGQTIKGFCSKIVQPQLFAMKYELATLTRSHLAC